MEAERQLQAQPAGMPVQCQLERERRLSWQLVEAKRQWHYWRSMHQRAKERIKQWQLRCGEAQQKLAEAQQRSEQLHERIQELEQETAGLKQRNQDLLRSPFGKRSEKRQSGSEGGAAAAETARPGADPEPQRPRGGPRGAVPHARVERSGLAVQEEWLEPEAERRYCADCGEPYARNGEESSASIEVDVRGYVRRIRRPRFRAGCGCAQRQGQPVPAVIAPREPTLFRGTSYGLRVWVAFLLQVYWQRHPVRAFEREWGERGVRLPAGTLLGHGRDFLTWFEPLEAAIAAHQEQARLVHGDETSWVVQVRAEAGQNPRCWLWACLTGDAVRFRVDPSRSAAAAAALFGKLGLREKVVLVCDRYAAYVKLAREHPEQFELSVCWAHARRDFVTLGRKRPDLQEWVDGILERIGRLYRRNAERLAQWDPQSGLEGQCEAFGAAQQRLAAECAALFEHAEREVAIRTQAAQRESDKAGPDPRLAPLQSLLRHREGLVVFVRKAFVPMDNTVVERALRRPVLGRKLSYGSHSADGAALQGVLLSVCATLDRAGIDLWRWLEAFLREWAGIGRGVVVVDPWAWLPWGLSAERFQALRAPWRCSEAGPDP